MNKNHLNIALIVLTVTLFLWWLSHRPTNQTDQRRVGIEPGQRGSPPARVPQHSTNVAPGAAPPAAAAFEPTPESNFTAWNEDRTRQTEAGLEGFQDQWRTPIDFYGKVVDEITNPVANAEVHFVWTDLSPEGSSEKQTTSDANGLFRLTSVAGKNLIVQVSKQGYYAYVPSGLSFNYAGEAQNFIPDSGNPVLFRLKQKGRAESLVHIAGPGLRTMRDFLLTTDGRPVTISLTDGNPKPEGESDLQIEFWTSPPQSGSRKFPWSCRISVPGGGLLPTAELFPFLAPESGYLQAEEYTADPNSDQWNARYEKTFYVKQRNGEYARVRIRVHASDNQPYFGIESYLNPTGSQNLEFDANNAIQPSQ